MWRSRELGLSVEAAAAAGLKVLPMWTGDPGVSKADAYQVRKRGQAAGEESQAAWSKMLTDQREWMQDRSTEYRTTYMRVLAGRRDAMASTEARQQAIGAMLKFEKKRPPEDIGFPESIRTDPGAVELVAPSSARWGAP